MNVLMPQLGETVTEGTVANWHKKVGDNVAADEIILDIETDKVSMEIPAPSAGCHHADPRAGRHDGRGRHRARRHREQRERGRVAAARREARAPAPAPAPQRAAAASYAAVVVCRDAAGHEHGEGAVRAARRGRRLGCRTRRRLPPKPSRATAINACRRPCAASPPSTGSISTAVSGSGRNGRITRRNVLEFIQRQQNRAGASRAAPRPPRSQRLRAPAAAAAPAARAPAPAAAPPAGAKTRAVHAHSQADGRAHGALEGHEPARAASRRGRLPSRRSRAQDRARRVEGEARPLADVLAVHRATPCAARSRTSRT